MKNLIFRILLVLFATSGVSQTTLKIGDIVFNTINSSSEEDSFSFVPLVNLEIGTEIKFTTQEWDPLLDELIGVGDTTHWVATQAVLAGTSIGVNTLNTMPLATEGVATGTITLEPKDNIFSYQGISTDPNFLLVFSTKDIDLPLSLISFTDLVQETVDSGMHNFQFNCPANVGAKFQLFGLFTQLINFNTNLSQPFDFFNNCDFTVTDAGELDNTSPVLQETLPLDDAVDVALDTNLQLVFNEEVISGIGLLSVKNSKDDSVVENFIFTNVGELPEGVTILGETVIIDLTNDLLIDNSYYVEIGSEVFGDKSLNPFVGITDKTIYNFSVINTKPEIVSHTPIDNAIDISVSSSISIVFDRAIEVVPETIEKIMVGNRTISLTDAQISISGATLTINPTPNWTYGAHHTVEIPDNAIRSISGGVFSGASFSFVIECGPDQEKLEGNCVDKCSAGETRDSDGNCSGGGGDGEVGNEDDTSAPSLTTATPEEGFNDLPIDTNITMVFNENLFTDVGEIRLRNGRDEAGIVEVFEFTIPNISPLGITIIDKKLIIDPSENLLPATEYYIEIDRGTITDKALNSFIGIGDYGTYYDGDGNPRRYSFTTLEDPFLLSSYVDESTGGYIDVDTDVTFVFNEKITLVENSTAIFNFSGIEIPFTDPQVTILNNKLTINLENELAYETDYTVSIPADVLEDRVGNLFKGGELSFTTVRDPEVGPPIECGENEVKFNGRCVEECDLPEFLDSNGECIQFYGPKRVPDEYLAKILEELGYYNIEEDEFINRGLLTRLNISDSNINSLEGIQYFYNLKVLECQGNFIDEMKLGLSKLEFLNCANNRIRVAEFKYLKKLRWLICKNNDLESLQLSESDSLRGLDCSNNRLEFIDIKNGHNPKFDIADYIKTTGYTQNEVDDNAVVEFNARGNPDLSCVIVDNPKTSFIEWGDYVDDKTYTNFTQINCDKVVIDDPVFEQLLIDKNIDNKLDGFVLESNMGCLEELDIELQYNQIVNLTLSERFKELKKLRISFTPVYNGIQTSPLRRLLIENLPKLDTLILSSLDNIDIVSIDAMNIKLLSVGSTTFSSEILDNLEEIEELTLGDTNGFQSIDFSKKPNLQLLHIYGGDLTALEFIDNSALTELRLLDVPLSSLNIAEVPNLEILELSESELNTIDLSNNKNLLRIKIYDDENISSLIISDLSVLEELYLSGLTDFSNIDLSTNTKLNSLHIDDVPLVDLDLSKNKALGVFQARGTGLNTVDVSYNINLKSINVDFNKLDIVQNQLLEYLNVSESQISLLQLNTSPLLTSLDANNTLLENIDISNNTSLKFVDVSRTKISALDLSKNRILLELRIASNSIDELKIYNNKLLEKLYCQGNLLSSLDLKMNVNLQELNCSDNSLTSLDLSKNKWLTILDSRNNDLEFLNLKSGSDLPGCLSSVSLKENNLSCVYVDDYIYSSANWLSVDEEVFFIEKGTCGDDQLIRIEDTNFEQALIDLGYDDIIDKTISHKNVRNVNKLNISNKNIKDLTGIEAFSRLDTLYAGSNSIEVFDFTIVPNLIDVDLYNNRLKNIDIPLNSGVLKNINLSKNELESLIHLRQQHSYNYTYSFDTFKIEENMNLHCVDVYNTFYFEAKATADSHTVFSTNCSNEDFDKIAIDDEKFEQALVDLSIDDLVDGFVLNDSIKNLKSLDISNKGIDNLIGINHFKKLRVLNCEGNNIENLDLSKMVRLDSVNCSNNKISEMKLYNSSNSTEGILKLNCNMNSIQNLEFEDLRLVAKIDASNNLFTEVDLSRNVQLAEINFSNNILESLNLKNSANEYLTEFDITENSENLTCIWVDDMTYSSVNWTKKDENVVFSESQCGELTDFVDPIFEGFYDDYINGKVLTSKISTVEKIDLSYNEKELSDFTGLIGFSSLKEINIQSNNSENLDFKTNDVVEKLSIKYCYNLMSIDISGLTNLKELNISSNSKLSSIDLSSNKKLSSVMITGNVLLESLYYEELPELVFASLACNKLENLDLSKLTKLESIYGFENSLKHLNVRNSNNSLIKDFYFTGNKNLFCIQVDDVNFSTENWKDINETSMFSEVCSLNVVDVSMGEVIKLYVIDGKIHSSNTNLTLEVINVHGQYVANENLQRGVYIVKVINLAGQFKVKKVLVR